MFLQRISEYVARARFFIFDFLFPTECLHCGRSSVRFCESCLAKFIHTPEEIHPGVFALFSYPDPSIRKSLRLLKYGRSREIAHIYGKLVFEALFEWYADDAPFRGNKSGEKILIVPIPLSKSRMRSRGFNQSEEIARAITHAPENTLFTCDPHALSKTKDTPSQVSIKNRTKRIKNLVGAYYANAERVRARHIIVIDDITTTGATFAEARRALKKAGAKKVICIAVAH